ncbi:MULTISPECIES: MarR family transcriptional regulator [unclassified Staphylococcus]|uniref:transcriptional regulator, SarA/Rot family n=1 Tax=unclassified Staphylococcus TaxID=91994 RepID=UPI0021CFB80A|nr:MULTISPECIES: MarR family transcriptional regulator [unclassified Staphylococcus]UXR69307.1 MarR family transcriptional regulator [Staphylococcus sp. IVB6246]UXR71358.1 MarR family transcriptional regulator [Staphylococcus sp. IVB6240]UXR73636.1 MarR family transcriptional regulator [Staphylococcus sp. IVB6238]UXR75953.1 MarR family transcriptional regulator [Staphylococcus sp. IVB6233]UXR80150.1 MarR family transcriptional regulator [Staphylococcus sp. IVB6218]
MEKYAVKDMKDLMIISYTSKNLQSAIKRQFNLTYEELFILTFIHENRAASYNVKDIIRASEFKPYYITKALQKLKELGFYRKKEMNKMNVQLL